MGLPAVTRLSPDEYLAQERAAPDKHEYLDGIAVAMVGVTRKHATVAGNVFNLVSAHLHDGPCRAYMADMKLHVETANAFFYPDLFVTCDPRDHEAEDFMRSAVLIVEVLSPSTAGFDRGEKFEAYRRIPALREYLLIDPERQRAECFRRTAGTLWTLHEVAPGGPIVLESLGLSVAHEEVFRRVLG
jgi:Uma2 family endonuclease